MSYLFPTYSRWDVTPAHCEGAILTDKNGKSYLDFTSGIGVCNLGHRHGKVQSAVEIQLNRFWHVSNLFNIEEQEKCAELLAKGAGLDAVFFANSGAEANEGAIKLARKATGKHKIIAFEQSFHGRTFATMSATGQDKIKQGFGPMLEKFVYVPYNDLESLKQEMDGETAAVILEVVQGEGGVFPAEKEFVKGVEQLCREYNALLIIDEVQTGIGRTGKRFAYQHYDIKPDIITSAKGLGSGFPIGAVIGAKKLKEHFGPGSHGSTFGGNPLAVAAATATMQIIFDDYFLDDVGKKGEFLKTKLEEGLKEAGAVKDIRGLGLMIGIELELPIQEVLANLREEGLLALSAGTNVLRLLPPLTVTYEELEEGINKMIKVINRS